MKKLIFVLLFFMAVSCEKNLFDDENFKIQTEGEFNNSLGDEPDPSDGADEDEDMDALDPGA
ncbi:MAG: hypothetical protein KAT68_01065 [Bacteroidales bacterium]|nr:hypothetical protein [Bacteroidales bacterium]